MIPPYRVYLFDVDGTLVDSAADICGAIQTVLSGTSRPDVPFEFLRNYIGRHLTDLFSDLFPEMGPAEIEALILEYRRIYTARNHEATCLYPGVLETIAALPGRKSTATTKGTPTTRIVLEKFGLLAHFDHVQGTDGFPSKPEPDVILRALQALEARPEECLFIGDSVPDMQAGRAAGVHVCAVHYGYGDPAAMAAYRPEYSIRSFGELSSLFAS
ncbi:MAG: HAD family hydrolase [Bryobacteraceae bacterium]|nr:HAD family hydrolase [Bryobacteraceae bacterium]